MPRALPAQARLCPLTAWQEVTAPLVTGPFGDDPLAAAGEAWYRSGMSSIRTSRPIRSRGLRLGWPAVFAVILMAAAATPTLAAGSGEEIVRVLLYLPLFIIAARLGGDLAVRLRQPEVLGELLVGVLIGNLDLMGIHWADGVQTDPSLDLLAQLGVILLLFEVGLESTVREMSRVGPSSGLVAVLGVAAPFALGWWAGSLLLPDSEIYVHMFLGATLTATSVGITARVLQDLGKLRTDESRIILGAAVIDDVLGLVILSVVTGIIDGVSRGTGLSMAGVLWIVAKSLGFLVAAIGLGLVISPRIFSWAAKLRSGGVLLAVALSFCFLLAGLAAKIGLAPIVGAYAAGLIVEDAHYKDFRGRLEFKLEQMMHPLTGFLVPVFFVLMGTRVDLAAFQDPQTIGLAAVLTLAAIVGKQVCSLGVLKKGVDRLSIGIGMIPRGEVGLIFANIGLGLTLHGHRIVEPHIYSAIVIMVIVTTMVTPPALAWSLRRKERRGGALGDPV